MSLRNDLAFGLRSLRRDWLVNAIAVISLALALAGNTAVFSLVNAVLYRPLPYPDADRIVLLGEREQGAPQTLTASPASFVDWRERNRTFGDLGAFQPSSMAVGRDARPVAVGGARVSPAFLQILGAPVLAGRAFEPAEGEIGRDDVVIVNDEFLANHMPDLENPVGTDVFVDGRSRTIIGVLPASFEFFLPDLQVWLPLTFDPDDISREERMLFVVGRLLDGVTMEQVRDDMQRVWDNLVLEYPDSNSGYVIDVLNVRHEIPNTQARTLFALIQGAVVFVLLIACVNIANLMSARGHRRQREIALRVILGASRWRILRQLVVESALLAGIAGAVGLAAAYAAVQVMGSRFAASVATPYIPALDATVMLFSLAMTVVATLLFGLIPARQSLAVDLAETMKEGGRGVTGSVRRKMLSRGLVIAEIALSLVLLAGAGMMVQAFIGLRESAPGFNDENLLTTTVTLPVDGERERMDLLAEIQDAARVVPGIADATLSTALPMNALAVGDAFNLVDRPIPEGEARPRAFWSAVATDYLTAMEIPLVRGRFFDAGDRVDAPDVAVVNESLARRHLPDVDPIGQRLRFRDREWEIVGIVVDTRQAIIGTDLANPTADPVIFVPIAQLAPASAYLLAHVAGNPMAPAPPLRARLEALHSRLVVGPMQTLEELVNQQFVGIDVMTEILRGFGYLALLLSALGTYGVLAYNVAQRSQEIGVRLAVGAQRGQVVRMIVRQGAILGVAGVLIGAPMVWAMVRVLNYALQGFGGRVETGSAFAVAAVLVGTAILASLFPALRAAHMHPVEVLRHE